MTLDEICIEISAVASGVLTGVETAERELSRLDKFKDGQYNISFYTEGFSDSANELDSIYDKVSEIENISNEELFGNIADSAIVAFKSVGLAISDGLAEYENYISIIEFILNGVWSSNEDLENSKDVLEGLSNEVGKLGSAYKSLSSGKDLAVNKAAELIYLYPQLARYIEETGDITFKEGQVVKDVWESEKEIYIAKINAQKNLTDAQIEEGNIRIAQYKKELEAMNAFFGVFSNVPIIKNLVGLKENQIISEMASVSKLQEKQQQVGKALSYMNNLSADGSAKRSSGGSSRKASGSSKGSDVDPEIEATKKALEDYRLMLRLDSFNGTKEQQEYLEKLYQTNKSGFDKDLSLFAEYYEAKKSVVRSSTDEIKRLSDKTMIEEDYLSVISAYNSILSELKESSKEYQSVSDLIAKAKEDLQNFYSDQDKDGLDSFIKGEEERINLLKSYEGVRFGQGQYDVYKFDLRDEIESYQKRLDENRRFIDSLKANGEELTSHQQKLLETAEKDEQKYYEKILALNTQYIKARQKEYETLIKEQQDALKKQTDALSKESKNQESIIKQKYSTQLKKAKEAANEEIEILRQKIADIDKLLRQQDIDDQDKVYERKKKQLEQMIFYEHDDKNKYELQKELNNLNSEYDKRKQREALEAMKISLNEQLNALKNNQSDRENTINSAMDRELAAIETEMNKKAAIYQAEAESKIAAIQAQMDAFNKSVQTELTELGILSASKKALYDKDLEYILGIYSNETQELKSENAKRLTGTSSFYSEKYKLAYDNSRDEKLLFSNTITAIIRELINRVSEFGDAGRRAGAAYASAFNAAANSISGGGSYSSYSTQSAAPVSLSFNQTITTNSATPSMIARQTQEALTDMLRYV